MSYKTLIVLVEREWRDELLDAAFALGERMDAHVVGLYAVRSLRLPAYVLAEAGAAAGQLVEAERAEMRERHERARAAFEAAALRLGHRSAEWRVAADDPLEAVCLSARYADLVIAGQPKPGRDDFDTVPELHHALALASGRPVLFVPHAGAVAAEFANVLVAWNASREAARALTDSLPLLQRAASVRVLVLDDGRSHGAVPGSDIALYLARHGVEVEIARATRSTEFGIGEAILSEAADRDADLLVMGAYGHSRITELVLGGATRTVLQSMTLPVLMAH